MGEKGFFAALFDFSFSSMITVKIVKLLYVLALAGAAIWTLIFIAAAFADSGGTGVVVLILSPGIFLIFAIFSRVYLELIIVLFKIADNTSVMAAASTTAASPASAVPPAPAAPQPPEERSTT